MAEVGSAFLSIIPSVRGMRSQLESQVGPEASAAGKTAGTRFGSSFKGAFGALAVTAGATAFVSFMGSSARAASDLNETANKSKIIFGANAAAMDKWGSTAARNLGLSKQEALASAAGFGDMFSQIGFSGKAAASMSKEVVQMSADLGSFNNLPTADVAERMSAAFRGEFDSLQAVIPNINAARVEQVALATTGKTAAKSLTAQEKAAAVLAIVQKDGARAAGDFARTSGDQANASKIAGASLQDLKAKIGTALIPALTKLALVATPAFEWMSKHQGTVIAFAAVIGVLLVGAFVAWTASIIAANIALLANPITWIIAAIVALIVAIVLIVKHWDLIKKKTGEVWDWIKGKLGAVWDWIKSSVSKVWQSVVTWIVNAWAKIKSTVTTSGAAVLAWFKALPGKLLSLLGRAGTWLISVGENIIRGIIKGIGNGFAWVKAKITELGGNVLQWAKDILHIGSPSKVMADQVGRWIPAGIAVGIRANAGEVHSAMSDLTSNLSMNARLSGKTGLGVTGATTDRPTQFRVKSGTLKIVGGREMVEGHLHDAVFEAAL